MGEISRGQAKPLAANLEKDAKKDKRSEVEPVQAYSVWVREGFHLQNSELTPNQEGQKKYYQAFLNANTLWIVLVQLLLSDALVAIRLSQGTKHLC